MITPTSRARLAASLRVDVGRGRKSRKKAFSTQLHFHEAHAKSGDLRECEEPRGLDDEELVRRAPQQLLALVGRVEHDLG